MSDGRGSTLDILDRAVARGIDVRLIFWRPDAETEQLKRNASCGSTDHIGLLNERRSGVKIRWDRAYPDFCQHQILSAGKLLGLRVSMGIRNE